MSISPYPPTITLKGNRLNSLNKRCRLPEWIKKQDLVMCCLYKTKFSLKDTRKLRVKKWKKSFQGNGNQKEAGIMKDK